MKPRSFSSTLWTPLVLFSLFLVVSANSHAVAEDPGTKPKEAAAPSGKIAPMDTLIKSATAIADKLTPTANAPPAAAATDSNQAAATAPAEPARPITEEIEHTAEGKIRFHFQGQRWLDVLQWLAENSKLSLDWQTMPDGVLNLSTQGSYTLDEARDLLNMHLAARGFTMLRRGEVLSLVKLEGLNPVLVPRVDPEELDSRDLHEVVRVSFPLEWLVAEQAAKEFAPLLSPHGKLLPMASTNRLEAIDAVTNLREIRSLLAREQSSHGAERLVVEFPLKHVKAEDVIDKLRELIGIEATSNRGRFGNWERMRMQVEKTKATAELAKNLGADARKVVRGEPDVHLVINEQKNSILANAPPDKLAVIRQAVQAIDVPADDSGPQLTNLTRMKIYRTKAVDPDAVQDLINDLIAKGKLGRSTQAEADDDSNMLIVYATPEDHLAIANLVSQFDDDGRDARVLPLRRLDANYARQAIRSMLQGYGEGQGRGRAGDQFRVEADPDQSRLLLWANDEEADRVKDLLAKLGETTRENSAGGVRVLNLPSQSTEQALQSLQRVWPSVRSNPLRIEGAHSTTPSRTPRTQAVKDRRPVDRERSGARVIQRPLSRDDVMARVIRGPRVSVATVAQLREAAEPSDRANDSERAEEERATTADRNADDNNAQDDGQVQKEGQRTGREPAITITETPDGQLIISSQDAQALDDLESLIQGLLPEQKDYRVYKLKHASPLAIEWTLKDVLGLNDQAATNNNSPGGLPRLRQRTLKMVSDLDTGTLLVQGASDEQLKKIEELIELYDQPETLDPELQRKTQIYEVKYSRASIVADVVKDVYRDLLSATDKAFSREREKTDNPSRDLGYGANYGSKIAKFKGLLSVGVEESSNSLVVSAPGFLIEDVMKLIREVDERAASHSIKVVKLNGVGADPLKQVFSQMPGVTGNTVTAKPQAAPTQAAQPQAAQQNGERSENRDRGDRNRNVREGGDRNGRDGR